MVNQAERAYRAWNILTECAKKRAEITYKQLGDALGIHHRPVRFVLGLIQEYCIKDLPPLTILVVNRRGGPGSGFIALNRELHDEGREEVWRYPWHQLENPFEFASDGTQYKALLSKLLKQPDCAEEVYRRVKVRGTAQLIFRDLLQRAYGYRCCFSGLGLTEGLEASHLIPWAKSETKDRLNVTNGLLLSSLHHRLFDAGLLTITEDYRIVFCQQSHQQKEVSPFERAVTSDLHLQPMRLPRNSAHNPSRLFIGKHNQMLQLEDYLAKTVAT